MSYDGQNDLILLSIAESRPTPPPLENVATEQKPQATISAGLRVFGYLFGVISAFLVLLSLVGFYSVYLVMKTWPQADAEILSSQIYSKQIDYNSDHGPHTSTVYGLRCNLRYAAASQAYNSQADLGYQNSSRNTMLEWQKRLPRGNHVPIVYDPSDPSRVHFAGDFSIAYAAPLRFFRIFVIALVICILLNLLGRSLQPPPDASIESSLSSSSIG
jgi:hypothetical protein